MWQEFFLAFPVNILQWTWNEGMTEHGLTHAIVERWFNYLAVYWVLGGRFPASRLTLYCTRFCHFIEFLEINSTFMLKCLQWKLIFATKIQQVVHYLIVSVNVMHLAQLYLNTSNIEIKDILIACVFEAKNPVMLNK